MALVYTKTLDLNKWLMSENNNIIEFTDDGPTRSILYAEFTVGSELPARIYADPNGVVWYNVKENVSPRLNDYSDSVDFNSVTVGNLDTFFKSWDKAYLNYVLSVNVVFEDGQTLQDTIECNFILGVEQPMDYFKEVTVDNKPMFVLSPLKDGTSNTHYMKYWEGYPFDISFTKNLVTDTNITKVENLSTQQETPPFTVTNTLTSMIVSDGTTNVSIEDYLPIPLGPNFLRLGNETLVELNKVDADCGTYIKFMNQYGRFNYWLFNSSEEKTKSKSKGNINNDFYNLAEAISDVKSLGRTSSNELKLYYERLTSDDIKILSGVLSSPKIYLYLGERYSKRNGNNWLEVSLKSSTITTNTFKNKVPSGTITLSLPSNKTISL